MKLVRKDERYELYDMSFEGFTVSKTVLHPKQETRGHSHVHPEFYVFLDDGVLELSGQDNMVKQGDIIVIEPNQFHRVRNPSTHDMVFVCLWKGKRQ